MSEVKRYRFKGAAGEYVYAGDFDDAMRSFLGAAELCLDAERREAALREELAEIKESLAYRGSLLNRTQLRAEAAEQRNAVLESLVRQFQGVAYGGFLDDDHLLRMQRDIDAALDKPTESGASE